MVTETDIKEIQNVVKITVARVVDERLQELIEYKFNSAIRSHLEAMISTAKDEAVRQIAAKLLKCALE